MTLECDKNQLVAHELRPNFFKFTTHPPNKKNHRQIIKDVMERPKLEYNLLNTRPKKEAFEMSFQFLDQNNFTENR